jgi:transcriptional regulator with XRE-family HTH domain
MDRFSKNIRQRASDLGLSHAEVARRAGLTERRFGNYVAGIREPDLATLVRISEALNTSPDVLLDFERPALPDNVLRARCEQLLGLLTEEQLQFTAVQLQALASAGNRE